MIAKQTKIKGSKAEVAPAEPTAPAAARPSGETVKREGFETHSLGRETRGEGDLLFALYLARISTIDRYRVPITEKGLPSAFRKAYEEAEAALKVFVECQNERK